MSRPKKRPPPCFLHSNDDLFSMNLFTRSYFKVASLIVSLAMVCGCVGRVPSSVKAQRNIEYAVVNGQSLKLDIYSPKNTTNKVPVLIWLYGGGWMMGDKSPCPIASFAQ